MPGLALRFNRILTRAPFLIWLPALILGSWALFQAYNLRWTADDAFISFRYARAAAAGHGLTFNPGERVEGYTNFLWTVLLIPVEFFKLRTEFAAWAMGLTSFGALLILCYAQMKKDAVWPGFFAALCLTSHMQIFATSGLETPLFALLVTGGLVFIGRHLWTADTNRGFLLLCLAALTRPDGLVIYAAAAIHFAASTRMPLREWAAMQFRAHLPSAMLLIPVWTAKSIYYGDFLPNTFYAKSAHEAFASQGLTYIALFAGSYWLFSALVLLVLVLPSSWRGARGVYASAVAIWLPYVAYVGGDFMFARFLIPVLPAAYLLMQEVASDFLRNRTVLRALLYVSVALSLILRPDPFGISPVVGDISEEHRIYTRQARLVLEESAMSLRPALLASGVRVGFVGAQAAFLYYWYPLFGIESETGLTDKAIARQQLRQRGKIGHEKQASIEYLASRDIHILMRPPPPGLNPPGIVRLKGIPGDMTIVRFDNAVFARLRDEGALQTKPDSRF